MNMTEQEFQRIYRYVKLHYGIDMSKKKEIMTGRLENYVMAHGYTSYDAFMNALEIDPTGQLEKRLLGMLTTNHTFFMREFEHMEFLSRVVLPELSKKLSNQANRMQELLAKYHLGEIVPHDTTNSSCAESNTEVPYIHLDDGFGKY